MTISISNIRLSFLCIAWIAALVQVVSGTPSTNAQSINFSNIGVINVGVFAFVGFTILTVSRLRHDSILILALLIFVCWALLDHFPDRNEWLEGGRYVLIFAALLPTMALVRATASLMPSVHRTQDALAQLPASATSGGFHLAANVFGGVINTGALALLSAAVPKNASKARRKIAAEAALRGMVTAAAWSPFFIAFAIGQGFVGKQDSWTAIAIGGVTTILFAAVSLPIFNRSFSFAQLRLTFSCLRPILLRLLIVLGVVLLSAFVFDFTALSAVVVMMPILVAVQFIRYPEQIKLIIGETATNMRTIADDILIISMAMLIGYFATRTGAFATLSSSLYDGTIPGWFALIATPFGMMLASIFGVHPVISSTVFLAVFTSGHTDVHPALLMQAHLIGWGAGTMSSVASLSVIMGASLFRVRSRDLVLGVNLFAAFSYALVGGIALSFINIMIF